MPRRGRTGASLYRRRLRPRAYSGKRKTYRSRGLRTKVKMPRYMGPGGSYSLGSQITTAQVPAMHSNGSRFNVKHRECIGTVAQGDPVGQATIAYAFNQQLIPTNANCFPWLNTIAKLFEQYQWKGLVVEYVPIVDSGATYASMGTVSMYCEYNAAQDVNPTSTQVLLNQMWAQGARSSDRITMPIEVAPNGTPIPVNWTLNGAAQAFDQRLGSLGRLVVGCEGCPKAIPTAQVPLPAPIVLGRLWLTYDIDLLKPQLVREFVFV